MSAQKLNVLGVLRIKAKYEIVSIPGDKVCDARGENVMTSKLLGDQLSWQSACLACTRSWIRFPHSPYMRFQLHTHDHVCVISVMFTIFQTLWPSGPRCFVKAAVFIDVRSNTTEVILINQLQHISLPLYLPMAPYHLFPQ